MNTRIQLAATRSGRRPERRADLLPGRVLEQCTRRGGTGKTHVATALAVQTVKHHRRKVRFFSTIEIVNTLEHEKAKGKAGQLAESLAPLDLVILPSRQIASCGKHAFGVTQSPAG